MLDDKLSGRKSSTGATGGENRPQLSLPATALGVELSDLSQALWRLAAYDIPPQPAAPAPLHSPRRAASDRRSPRGSLKELVERKKRNASSLKECSSWHPSPRGSLKELPAKISPRGSLKEYSMHHLAPQRSLKELSGRLTPGGSMKDYHMRRSPHGSLKTSPVKRFNVWSSLRESSSSSRSNPHEGTGMATSAMLVSQLGTLSPLPMFSARSPPSPGSPVIPRIISTNWESLGMYDPYRYRQSSNCHTICFPASLTQ